MEARVYIDGFNLYYGIKKWPAYKWLNLEDLVDRVFPNDDIQLIRYFTARVKGKISPDSPARQQAYLAALSSPGARGDPFREVPHQRGVDALGG